MNDARPGESLGEHRREGLGESVGERFGESLDESPNESPDESLGERFGRPAAGTRVCAVIVTFHPDPEFPARLSRIAAQADRTVIVDNGSGEAEVRMLRAAAAGLPIALLAQGENLGVACALNAGIRRALEDGYAWTLLLDQDTEVDPDMVDGLWAARESCPAADRVAIVGSRFRDTAGHPNRSALLGSKGELWEEVESVITSGSLLSLAAYAAIGPFRDEFFIDYVDTEFCFRARANGYRILQTRRPLMSHTVGAPMQHKLLWTTKWTTNHSPDRRYYSARNNTVLLREFGTSGRTPWQWKSFVRCFRLMKRIALYEHDKTRKIRAVAQGWWDGLRGNMGPRRP
jgi:rhamnosyltransferase